MVKARVRVRGLLDVLDPRGVGGVHIIIFNNPLPQNREKKLTDMKNITEFETN